MQYIKAILIMVAVVVILPAIVFLAINSGIFTDSPALPNLTAPSYITVYKDINSLGSAQTYGVGSYTLAQMQAKGTENDSISSIEIPSGFTVTLYEHDDFKGVSITKTASDSTLVDDGWNDLVSSIIITSAR